MPEQGDIVLVPVPFTDLSSQKRRPVVVVSNDEYNRATADLVVVAMTSNPEPSVYSIPITQRDLERGRLNRPGTVRADKVFTLAQAMVVKPLGRVDRETRGRIRARLEALLQEPSWTAPSQPP